MLFYDDYASYSPFPSGPGRAHATEMGEFLVLLIGVETNFAPILLGIPTPGAGVRVGIAPIVYDCPYVRVVR